MRILAFLLFFFIIFASCKKLGFGEDDEQRGVYIVGYTGSNPAHAIYWDNGTIHNLPPQGHTSIAQYIVSSGNDIYTAGFDNINGSVYWKDSTQTFFPIPLAAISGIDVQGNDVYIGANIPDSNRVLSVVSGYWKNGQYHSIEQGGTGTSSKGIKVIGDSVYMAGDLFHYNNFLSYQAVYWRNGKLIVLMPGTQNSEAMAITVSGNDIYVAGYFDSITTHIPVYWKNGQQFRLSTPSSGGYVSSIAVSGDDVYVAGWTYNTAAPGTQAVYWKNGDIHYIGPHAVSSWAWGIAIYRNDVYMAGSLHSPTNINLSENLPVYWKNGKLYYLPIPGTAGEAKGIALIK